MQAAFWDASALVPLCVLQNSTPRATKHYANYEIVVWWATSVEIAGALARLVRIKRLDSPTLVKAHATAAKLADNWEVIAPSQAVLDRALKMIELYDLRAADALQLAAALDWCNDNPSGVAFLTADQRLREAANLAGFDAKTV